MATEETTSVGMAQWVERKTLIRNRWRKRSRTLAVLAEDAYLRVDVACGLQGCPVCPHTAPALPAGAPHLLLPDAAALASYLDVWELAEVVGLVLLSSEIRQLRQGGNMRRTARLRGLYTDKRRGNHLFDNLHCLETTPASQADVRQGATLLAAADWYSRHIGCRLPVVVLSDSLATRLGGGAASQQHPQQASSRSSGAAAQAAGDDDADLKALLRQMDMGGQGGSAASGGDALDSLLRNLGIGDGDAPTSATAQQQQQQQPQQQGSAAGPLEPGVHILSVAQYFGGGAGVAHPPAVLDIYDSLAQSRAEEAEAAARGEAKAGGTGYRAHLSQAAMDAGLQAGTLLQGTLSVSRRDPQEATVRIGGGELGGAGRQVVVSGRAALNRSVHGDTVAIRLLPREHWRPLAAVADAAAGAPGEDRADLLVAAAAGDGAETAVDEAAEPGVAAAAAGSDAQLDAELAQLFSGAAADALLPAGEVVGVLSRSGAEVVACLAEEDERALAARQESSRQESALCIPMDRRLPKLRLRSRQLHRLLGQRLVLRLDGWEQDSTYPHAHVVRVLGPLNDLRAETDGVLAASGVHWQPFSEGALRELPPVASSAEYRIPPSELASRRDLRGPDHLVASIDPPGCTDVDDALSVRFLGRQGGSGGSARELVEVGVHIADVSFFVRQGGLLDSEAAARCTTVYLVDRRLDMLPDLLSGDLCSLRGGLDRYAVSVLWTLDAETLDVQSVWFGRTLIRSRYQLEYTQAQAIMDGAATVPDVPGTTPVPPADRPELQRALTFLARLAAHRRQQRLAAGALELESAELRFRTGADGQPTDVLEIPMMRIVAEMMIAANASVAERTCATFPRAALLRRHPPPRREAFAEVQELCASLLPRGSVVDLEAGPVALADSLAAACAAAPPALASLIRSLATRAMSEAEYFSTGDVMARGGGGGMSHYGLALQHYTHFTSPIRRYADIVVHRQLLEAVAAGGHEGMGAPQGQQPVGPPPLPSMELSARAAVMNERHRTAKRAQKDCSDLYLLLLLHAQPHVEAATVYGFRGNALLVFVARYGLRGVIHLVDKEGVCKPPLRGPGDEELHEPYVLAYRRSLEVAEQGGQLCVRHSAGGALVAAFSLRQRVWVELSAEGSRAHGPTLRMRLLADSHPTAREAASKAAPAEAGAEAGSSPAMPDVQQGCDTLPRGGPRAYRPPGIGGQQRQAPPGFEPQQRQVAADVPGAVVRLNKQQQNTLQQHQQQPGTIAAALEEALREVGLCAESADTEQQQQQRGQQAEPSSRALVVDAPPSLPPAVQQRLLRLQQRASRAAVLAAGSSGGPMGARARQRAAQAERCREQLEQLKQQLLVVM